MLAGTRWRSRRSASRVQQLLLRRIQGQDLREALITIGLAIVIADQCLAYWGGSPRDITVPARSLGRAGSPASRT